VLQLIAEGMTNEQIGNSVFLAEDTVKNDVSRIMEKLHAGSGTKLCAACGTSATVRQKLLYCHGLGLH
jgi:DNA-binding NarL/FixJ family response regulator